MEATGKSSAAFLGHAMAKMTGPATIKLRVRSQSGGAAKIDSFPNGSADANGMVSLPFEVKTGDWQDVQVQVTSNALLGTLRVYLPDSDIDSIEVVPAKGGPMKFDF
jgi:hypothetical protein